jgi:hypothetical protein
MIIVLRHWFWFSCTCCRALQLLDALLKLVFRDNRLVERPLPDAVWQGQLGCQGNIALADGFSTFEGCLGTGCFEDH